MVSAETVETSQVHANWCLLVLVSAGPGVCLSGFR